MELYAKRPSKKASLRGKETMRDYSIFEKVARTYAQDQTLNVNPTELQVGQSVYDESDNEMVVIQDDDMTTDKTLMPKDQIGVGVPQGVTTVEDAELGSGYTVQPGTADMAVVAQNVGEGKTGTKAKGIASPSTEAPIPTKAPVKVSKAKGNIIPFVLDGFRQSSDKQAVIKKLKESDKDPSKPASEQEWGLYTSDGKKLLGRHPSKEKAQEQEDAIHAREGNILPEFRKQGQEFEESSNKYMEEFFNYPYNNDPLGQLSKFFRMSLPINWVDVMKEDPDLIKSAENLVYHIIDIEIPKE